MSQLLRKISAKTVCGKLEKPTKATKLMVIYGTATRVREGNSDFGPWVALVGRFEAVHIETGEVSEAPQAFLPEPMNSMIAEQLTRLDDEGNRVVNSIDFAIEVGVKPSDSPVGYEYTTKEVVKPDESDPLAKLRESVKPALPAPKK